MSIRVPGEGRQTRKMSTMSIVSIFSNYRVEDGATESTPWPHPRVRGPILDSVNLSSTPRPHPRLRHPILDSVAPS